MKSVNIIVVLYYPSKDIIEKWRRYVAIMPKFNFYFVDNTPSYNDTLLDLGCFYISLKNNLGIAAAQNIGINKVIDYQGYIIFFDQDSDINDNYCTLMVNEYERIKINLPSIAILGPTIVNKETNKLYKSGGVKNKDSYVVCDSLISSGSIVERETLVNVGLMEDDLFIDSVDFEWCWRAISMGYACVKTEKVCLLHKVGQKCKSFLGVPFIVSSPFRYYFQYRNWIWMVKRSYVPSNWKIKSSIRRIAELFIIPFFAEQKMETIRNMWKGIKDGLLKN